jgi:16S rRNA A1518/A1519 N6-dimethyltransferase RsmA/KsgA/DIM1 with predicted DNA glycosylase/AP lyase activity
VPFDPELGIAPNPDLDQHFLTNPAKLSRIIQAGNILPEDHVVEIGAGIGTVAECIPAVQSLTVIEYDENLIDALASRVPHATVINGDALDVLPSLPIDVLISNLPGRLTDALTALLPAVEFRMALITAPTLQALSGLVNGFQIDPVTVLEPDDFRPPQSKRVHVVRVRRVPT